MIMLWGLPSDPPMAAVASALHRQRVPFVLLDQRSVRETSLVLQVTPSLEATVRIADREIDLSAMRAVYLRPHDSRRVGVPAGQDVGSSELRHALDIEEGLMAWVDVTEALVVNPPMAMAPNGSKPFQASQIRAHGFLTPETLVTTDPAAVREFWTRHGTVVYKSVSGVRSVVSRLTREHEARIGNVSWCPTQFQAYVPGADYRVHVVGDELFACEIVSDADDYRYASRTSARVAISPTILPAECAERCLALSSALGLALAGIDLRRTPDGGWCCFEVNPSPGFSYYQHATGQPIDEAVARLLATGHRGGG